MIRQNKCLALVLGVAIAGGIVMAKPSMAQEMTKAEKIFAELAKLPAGERQKRIIEGAKKEGEVNLIRSLRGKLGHGRIELFRKAYPWLDVKESELGSQDAAYRMVAEETAGRHLTDVVSIATADMLELLDKKIAARYPTPESEKILKQYNSFKDSENRWTPWAINEHGIAYNTNLVKEPPGSYMGLCDERFKGNKISLEPAETRFLGGVYNILGQDMAKMEEWVKCIAANDPVIQRGHTGRLRLMLSGDHAISPDQYLYRGTDMHKKNPQVPFAVDYGAPVIILPVANVINKNTPHPYATALFVDWTLGKDCQEYLRSKGRGPVSIPHPFFPDDAKFVPFLGHKKEVIDNLHEIWAANIRER